MARGGFYPVKRGGARRDRIGHIQSGSEGDRLARGSIVHGVKVLIFSGTEIRKKKNASRVVSVFLTTRFSGAARVAGGGDDGAGEFGDPGDGTKSGGVSPLSIPVSDPPTKAEVQAVVDKLSELIASVWRD